MESPLICPESIDVNNSTTGNKSTSEMANEAIMTIYLDHRYHDSKEVNTNDITSIKIPVCNDSDSNKILSIEGQCLFEGSAVVNDNTNEASQEFIDYEELIDLTRDSVAIEKTLQDIKEFESVVRSFDMPETRMDDGEEILNLDDFNDFFERDTETSDLYAQTIPVLQTNNSRTSSTDDIVENNSKNISDCNEHSLQAAEVNIVNQVSITSNNEDVNSKKHESDIIYITSDEETQSINSDGYNSSDFEFITETEAKMDGYVINFNPNDYKNTKNVIDNRNNDKDEVESSQTDGCRDYASQIVNEYKNIHPLNVKEAKVLNSQVEFHSNTDKTDAESVIGEGPSGLNRQIDVYSDRNYRENHIVPEEQDFLDLFQGPYDPVLPVSDIILLENKSIRPSPMNSRYEGIGFDKLIIWRKCQPDDSSEEEYEDEAKESLDKILSLYPEENRKPIRRRH